MNPYFSIIIPCLNEELFLPKLLNNLNSQTFTDFETIVVDGNSDDKTAKVTTEFRAKYPLYLYTTTTRNVSFQRNLGAKKANGKIFIFFDADTQIPKNYLGKIAKAFETKHPHFLTTYMRVSAKTPLEKMYPFFINLIIETGKATKLPFSFGAMQAVKRGAFFDIGGYDTKTKFSEDTQLFQKLYNFNYKFLLLKRPCYVFCLRRFRAEGTLKAMIQYFQLNFNILLKGYHVPPKVKYQMGGHVYSQNEVRQNEYTKNFKPIFTKLSKKIKQSNQDFQDIIDKIFSSK